MQQEQQFSRIDWVTSGCRLLKSIAAEFAETRPFAGLTIGTAIHLEPKTAALLMTLKAGGARLVATGNLNSTQPATAAFLTALLFAGGGVLVWLGLLGGYRVTSPIVWDGPSNPLLKTVVADPAAWLANFRAHPALWAVPGLGVAAPLLAAIGFRARWEGFTFLASKLGVAMIVATVGVAMFPILLPSSSNPAHSLAVFDASSSRDTLRNMLLATVVFMPLILAYTAWVYRVLWGKVTEKGIEDAGHSAY